MTKLRIEVSGLCCFIYADGVDAAKNPRKTLTALLLKDAGARMHHQTASDKRDQKTVDYGPHIPLLYVKRKHMPGGDVNDETYTSFDLADQLVWPPSISEEEPAFPDRLTDLSSEPFNCTFKGLTAVKDNISAIVPLNFKCVAEDHGGEFVYTSATCPEVDAGKLNFKIVFETEVSGDEVMISTAAGKQAKLRQRGGSIEVRIKNLPQKLTLGEDPDPNDRRGDSSHFLMLYDLFNCGNSCFYYPVSKKDLQWNMTSTMFTCMPGGGGH